MPSLCIADNKFDEEKRKGGTPMRKPLSLLLALVLTLSLCVTAFAGIAAETTVLRLTGDAADQVLNLNDGQRVHENKDLTVRLRVQADPGAQEYTVALDGKPVTADHSTSRYHFYYLPAKYLSGDETTLSVNNADGAFAPVTQALGTAQVTVRVNGLDKVAQLSADGSTDYKNPTVVTVNYTYEEAGGNMARVFFKDPSDGVTLCTGFAFNTGDISGYLTQLNEGYTGQQLFFYKDPKAQSKSASALWTDADGVNHYYTITAKRAAQDGYVLAPGARSNESDPGGANNYDVATGCITGSIKGFAAAPFTFHDLTLFNSGKASTTTTSPAFPTDKTGLYYLDDINVYFARPGRYWVPASVEKGGVTYTGEAPFLAWWTLTALNAQLEKAKAVQADTAFTALPESVQQEFNAIVDRLTAGSGNMSGNVMVKADGTIAKGNDTATDIQARDFGGKQIFTERLLEGDECAIMDLMAIFETYKSNKSLGQYQAQAYRKIAALGLSSFTEVTTEAQKTSYIAYKQAKWDLLKTTDLDGINAILTGLGLEAIEAPQVTLGDINGDGSVTLADAAMLVQCVNKIADLTDEQKAAADINGDGSITLADAAILVQYVNKIISVLPGKQ